MLNCPAVFVWFSDPLNSCCVASAVRLALNHKVLTSILSQQASVCKFYAFLQFMGLVYPQREEKERGLSPGHTY